MSDVGGVEILVAEDEDLLRELFESALTDAGFAVTLATDGANAMRLLDDNPGRFHALLTDIRIGPGPDGWALATKAREHAPDLPVIYMSGDSADQWPSKGVPKSVMIPKPFVLAQVVTALATLLNDTAGAV